MTKLEIPKQSEFDSWNRVIAVDMSGNQISSYKTGLGTIFPFRIEIYANMIRDICNNRSVHPIRLEVSPTDFCNHNCRMCIVRYHYTHLHHHRCELPYKVLENIIDDAQAIGIKLITLSGTGEIFTYKRIESVLKKFLQSPMRLMVFTNGSLISDLSAEYMVKSESIINISINAGDRASYQIINGNDDFGTVISNMRKLKEIAIKNNKEPVLGCSFVVLHENISSISLAAQNAKRTGFDYITFKPAAEIDFISDFKQSERELMIEQIEKAMTLASPHFRVNVNFNPLSYSLPFKRSMPSATRCFQGIFSLNISSDGGLYPCPTQATLRKFMKVPNIKEVSLREFVNSDGYRQFYMNDFRDNQYHSGCFNDRFNLFISWLYEMNIKYKCLRFLTTKD